MESSEESGQVWISPSAGSPPVCHSWSEVEAKEGLYFKIHGQWFPGINVKSPKTGFIRPPHIEDTQQTE